jgi:hypothetical protein
MKKVLNSSCAAMLSRLLRLSTVVLLLLLLQLPPCMASAKPSKRIRDDSLFSILAPPPNRMTHRNDALFPQLKNHQNQKDRSLVETVHQTAVLTTLTAILEMANLENGLSGGTSGPYTVLMRKCSAIVAVLHRAALYRRRRMEPNEKMFLLFPFL